MDMLEHRNEWHETYTNGWLAHYQETGAFDWKLYKRPKNSVAPSGPGVDLRRSRLMLISSAGGYIGDAQEPFDAANPLGDYSIRVIPSDTPLAALRYAHDHYDHTAVDDDPQTLVPLRHLDDLVSAGTVGELAPSWVSFMGYQPDATRVLDEMIPQIVAVAKTEQIDAALLVPS